MRRKIGRGAICARKSAGRELWRDARVRESGVDAEQCQRKAACFCAARGQHARTSLCLHTHRLTQPHADSHGKAAPLGLGVQLLKPNRAHPPQRCARRMFVDVLLPNANLNSHRAPRACLHPWHPRRSKVGALYAMISNMSDLNRAGKGKAKPQPGLTAKSLAMLESSTPAPATPMPAYH